MTVPLFIRERFMYLDALAEELSLMGDYEAAEAALNYMAALVQEHSS
jgi:hypothetical protein